VLRRQRGRGSPLRHDSGIGHPSRRSAAPGRGGSRLRRRCEVRRWRPPRRSPRAAVGAGRRPVARPATASAPR
jgi:hypothetical protein